MGDDNATEFAARVAPEIDRVRLALLAAAGPQLGALGARYELTPDAAQVLSALRNLRPARTVKAADLAELYVYQRDGYTTDALGTLRTLGMVAGTDEIALTAKGSAGLDDVMDVLATAASTRWPSPPVRLPAAVNAARAAVAHASRTGGVTFGVVAPVNVTPDMAPLVEFLELLTPLRFHRFDAHVTAWREEGLTADQLPSIDEARRERIEARTNQLAAAAFADLSQDQREVLLAVLTEFES